MKDRRRQLFPWTPRRSNCLVWALSMKCRFGGYIAHRPSKLCRLLPHFLWSPDLDHWYSYQIHKSGERSWNFWWFPGEPVEGDPPNERENHRAFRRFVRWLKEHR